MSGFQDKQAYGEAGIEVVTNGALAGGEYCELLCVTAVTLTVFTSAYVTGTITGIALPAGTKIRVPFTAATCGVGETIIATKSFQK